MIMAWTQRGEAVSLMPKKQKNSSGDSSRKPWVDPDDAPEITDEMLDRAVFRHGDTIIRRGRPQLSLIRND
jgi:hypothetical protein